MSTTIPDLTIDEHIQSFLELVAFWVPWVDNTCAYWFDFQETKGIKKTENAATILPSTAILTLDGVRRLMQRLIDEGRPWINFICVGSITVQESCLQKEAALKDTPIRLVRVESLSTEDLASERPPKSKPCLISIDYSSKTGCPGTFIFL